MKNFFCFILILMLMLSFCDSTLASSQVFEAEGIFVMGDNDTKTKAKDFALQDAKRLALEQAGTYLRSITQVVNGQVTKDDIISIASGVIKLERVISEETKLNNGLVLLAVKARFTIDSDDLKKKIETLQQSNNRQEEIQKMNDLQNRYDTLLAENNNLKTQLSQTSNQSIKEQLLFKTQEIDAQFEATKFFDKGSEYYNIKDYDKAIESLSKAIMLDPQYVSAYYNRGLSYNIKHQYDLAAVDFNKALQLNPKLYDAYFDLGLSYMMLQKHDLAIVNLSKIIKVNPQYPKAYFFRGCVYATNKQFHSALVDLNKSLELDPTNEDAKTIKNIVLSMMN